MNFPNKIFEGLTVIELASVLAGPAVGMFFSELGARVIKIENLKVGGDITRQWKTITENKNNSKSAYYHAINWNKEELFLDLSTNYDQFKSLLSEADFVISNMLPKSAKKLKVDFETLVKIKDDIILGSINAYGHDSDKAGFDALIQAESGWMSINGISESGPLKMPVALMDILAAHQLKEGLLIAYINKLKTGKAAHVSVSLFETALASLVNQSSNFLNNGTIPVPKGSLHPNIAPYGEIIYSSDGVAFLLAIGNDKQFSLLLKAMQIDANEMMDFKTNTERLHKRSQLIVILNKAMQNISAAEFNNQIDKYNLPIGRINNISQAIKSKTGQNLIIEQGEIDNSISKRIKTNVFKIHFYHSM